MAATDWQLFNSAKKYIGAGVVQLGISALKLRLFTSASNASTFTLSTLASVNNQCTGGNYPTDGKSLASISWTVGASAKSYLLAAADVAFSGDIPGGVKYAVIGVSGGKALCWSRLSSAAFTVNSPNTMTVKLENGIFEMH